jgi:hypothetical protein
MKAYVHLWYLAEFFIKWEIIYTKFVDKIKTYFMFNNLFSENRAVYEMMQKNVVQLDRPQITK